MVTSLRKGTFTHMELIAGSVTLTGFLASLCAGLASGAGAAPIFFKQTWNENWQRQMLGIAGGIMLAATVFSLISPALDMVEAQSKNAFLPAVVVGAAIAMGAVSIWLVHNLVPHEHLMKGPDDGSVFALGRNWLFIAAITLHNFPEGLSVGVAFGPGDIGSGLPVALGIGIQNMPEGLAVAAALLSGGFDRTRAFLIALATGLVEPIGGLVGAMVVSFSDTLLPWGLAFAGGAMLFVIVGEVIPETYRDDRHHGVTATFVTGFVIMMLLDVALG